jgi:hypothetical protein
MELVSVFLRNPCFAGQMQLLRFRHGEIEVSRGSCLIRQAQLQRVAPFQQPGWLRLGKQPRQQSLKGYPAPQS